MKLISRKRWGARQARERTYQDPRSVKEIFLHYSESPGGQTSFASQAQAVRNIQDFHMGPQRAWADVAYSYLVINSWRSRVFVGRGARVVPAAQLNHNTNTIAVCILMQAGDKLHPVTRLQLRRLIWRLRRKTIRKQVPVRPHSAVTETSCPGDEVRAFIRKHY